MSTARRGLQPRDPVVLREGLYRTDAFHRQPIFAVRPPRHDPDQPPLLVRSWEEAFALHGRPTLADVNHAWIGRLVSGSATANMSPYRRIQRLPRCHWVTVEASGHFHTAAYDTFSGGPGPLPENHLHALFRTGLLTTVEQALQGYEGPVGCEHSSGLDSNAILGCLRHGLGIPAERLHTLSDDGWGEGPLIQSFQKFHGLKSNQVHNYLESTIGDSSAAYLELNTVDILHRLWAPSQSSMSQSALQQVVAEGVQMVFSGFGGDQALTHNAANVPTDLVADGRWQDLVRWKGSRSSALRSVVGRGMALASRAWATTRVRRHIAKEWSYQRWLGSCLTKQGKACLEPYLREDYPLELDIFLRQAESIQQRVMADWVTVRAEEETRLAGSYGVKKFFPMLNEPLIAMLLAQDPLAHARRAGKGRRIARRALEPFLPPYLRQTPWKSRPVADDAKEQWLAETRDQTLFLIPILKRDHHGQLNTWWPLASMLEHCERVMQMPESDLETGELADGILILSKINAWMHWLDEAQG